MCNCLQDGEETEIEVEGESHTTIDSMVLEPLEATNPDVVVEALIDTNYVGKLKPAVEAAIKAKWGKIMGPDIEIVVSRLHTSQGFTYDCLWSSETYLWVVSLVLCYNAVRH
jgi:hypothetical protein